jgi:hypothetical protein
VASTITNFSNAINVNYPIPGQDNDSQGFRTNFSNIQSSLTVAGDEISRLQVNAVNLNDTNDFGNNVVKKASFQACNQVVYEVSTSTISAGNILIDYNNGNYQKIELDTTATYTITLQNYPTDTSLSKAVRFEITREVRGITINWSGGNEVLSRSSNSITYADSGICVWDIWTTNDGTTLFANEVNNPVNVSRYGDIHGSTGTTTMTAGFVCIPAASGAPSGIPSGIPAGQIPMYFDTSSDYLYIYNGSWKKAGPFSV